MLLAYFKRIALRTAPGGRISNVFLTRRDAASFWHSCDSVYPKTGVWARGVARRPYSDVWSDRALWLESRCPRVLTRSRAKRQAAPQHGCPKVRARETVLALAQFKAGHNVSQPCATSDQAAPSPLCIAPSYTRLGQPGHHADGRV